MPYAPLQFTLVNITFTNQTIEPPTHINGEDRESFTGNMANSGTKFKT